MHLSHPTVSKAGRPQQPLSAAVLGLTHPHPLLGRLPVGFPGSITLLTVGQMLRAQEVPWAHLTPLNRLRSKAKAS